MYGFQNEEESYTSEGSVPEIESTLAITIREVFNERVFKMNSKIE